MLLRSDETGEISAGDEKLALILARLTQSHREEMSRLRALVVRYREFIEDHGLTPPDESGSEALERFRHAFLVAGLDDDLQHPELLADWWRKVA